MLLKSRIFYFFQLKNIFIMIISVESCHIQVTTTLSTIIFVLQSHVKII